MSHLAYLFFIIATATTTFAENNKKIPVNVYYESLCPDSIKFITKQLYPAWDTELKSFMNLNLVPFGKANYTHAGENYTFNCHHGEKECMGNKVHACALKKIMDMDMQVKFINCVMTMNAEKKPEEYPTKMCANDVKLAADVTSQLESCATSNEGDALLAEFGDMTMKFQNPLKSVPSVTFTNEPNKDNAEATSNFRMALCSQIMDPKPAICNKNSASSYHSSLFLVPLTYFFTLKL